jgi:hypothetical protein
MLIDISDPKCDVETMFWDVLSMVLYESTNMLIEAWIMSGYVTREQPDGFGGTFFTISTRYNTNGEQQCSPQ